MMAPPSVPPARWLWLVALATFGTHLFLVWSNRIPAALEKKLRAFSAEFCKYQYASPCVEFAPLLVCTSTTAPNPRPNSGAKLSVRICISLMVLMLTGWRCWFSLPSSLETPSVRNVVPRVPVPLNDTELPLESVGLFWPDVGLVWKPGNRPTNPR